jgi:hypothetical protein
MCNIPDTRNVYGVRNAEEERVNLDAKLGRKGEEGGLGARKARRAGPRGLPARWGARELQRRVLGHVGGRGGSSCSAVGERVRRVGERREMMVLSCYMPNTWSTERE